MKRFSWLFLLPLASGVLLAQTEYSIIGSVPTTGTIGTSYTGTMQVNPAVTTANWSISVGSLPPGLNLSSSTGPSTTIVGTPITAGLYSFTVLASFGPPTTGATLVRQNYTITISAPPVYISPTTLPNGTLGTSYSQQLTAFGGYGAGTYSFSLDTTSAGPLPTGLVLSTNGAIAGTCDALGTFPFTIRATSATGANGASVSGIQSYSVAIVGAPLSITTTSLPAGTVGVLYSQTVAATGGTPPYTWQLGSGSLPGGLTLDPPSGNIYGTPTAAGSFTFQVKVTDSAQGSTIGSFTIKINPAALVVTTASLPAGIVGTAYTATTLAATGGTPPYTWSAASGSTLPSGLSISSAGVISGTPTAAGTFPVTLQVTDSAQVTATKTYSVTVAAAAVPLSITTQAPLAGGEVGLAYTQAFAATGGTTPYTWSVSAGAAPTGLTLNASTGSLTGTPTAVGTFTFTVQVADSAAHTATQAFTIAVIAAVKIITPPPMVTGTTGTPYTVQFLASGGLTPYTWSVAGGSVPTGLSLNTATGALSGTPTAAGTYTFTMGVADQNGSKDSASYTITIVSVLSITTQAPLPVGVVGVAYTQAFAATGGATPYQWFISTGAAPTGLTLSSTAGSLTGTPTAAGSFNFTIQVVDASGRNATASFTITVTAALTITTATLPNGTVGTAYSQTLAATGGTGVYTWAVSTGTLPTGITLSSAGSLSGTPSASGAFTFTVGVSNGGQTATQSFTITVSAALTITTATLPNATVGTAYSQTLTAAGGTGTFTWSVSTGALPTGITLSSAGSLSGTPSTPGAFTFTVTVTNGGQTATQSLTITVGVPPGPSATITGLPATATPATQPALGITIPTAYPLPITGTVTLTFVPASGNPDDPNVQFTTGGRTVSFTVAANSTQVVFSGATPGVQTGTSAGTITLTLDLKAAGIDITPSLAPTSTLVVAKSAPVITSATVSGVTSSGFNIVVVGYATSREMVSATVTFTAASGVTLSSSSATVSLASVFTTWYQSSASAAYGTQFSLTMPFTITNGTSSNPLTSVSVMLTSGQGNSTTVSATY